VTPDTETEKAFDLRAQRWDTPIVAKIAGIEPQVLLGWRRRHGFLGGSAPGSQGLGGYKHSLIDIAVAATVALMVRRGLEVADAISAEDYLAAHFQLLLTDESTSSIFAFHPRGRDAKTKVSFYFEGRDKTLGEFLGTLPGIPAVMVVDLQAVIDRCMRALKIKMLRVPSISDE
jgi:hypothetical protein